MSAPLISVIIPTFNRGPQLQDAVRSVLTQSYKNLELIVVDDSSVTPVSQTLSYIGDLRLKIIRHNRNAGVSAARNTGAEAAQGEFLAFLDDDDRWQPQKLMRQLAFMEASKGKYQASVTDFATEGNHSLYSRHNSRVDPAWLILTGCATTMGSSMLVRRDAYHKVGGFDLGLRRSQDWDWLLRYHEHNHKMAIIPESLTIYRGDHRSNTKVVADSISLIEKKHKDVLAGPDRQAFNAALTWKRARNHMTERRYLLGAVELAYVAVRHPVNFVRYVRTVLKEPVRHLLHGRGAQQVGETQTYTQVHIASGPQ